MPLKTDPGDGSRPRPSLFQGGILLLLKRAHRSRVLASAALLSTFAQVALSYFCHQVYPSAHTVCELLILGGWIFVLFVLWRAISSLKTSNETFRVINTSAFDAILITDAYGRILHANPAAERMFGYAHEQLLGQNVHDLLAAPECREQAAVALRQFALERSESAVGRVIELDAVRADGVPLPVELSVGHAMLDGQRCVLGIVRDITERKRATDELQRSQEALESTNAQLEAAIERANRMAVTAEVASSAKSEFLTNMSHEIRTPMTAILGYTDVLMDEFAHDSRCLERLRIIRRNGEHLLGVINDILDLSRIEAEKLQLSVEPCSPVTLVREVASLIRGRAEDKHLAFLVEFVGSIPETMQTDPLRLRQILLNLLGNAIKFTREGGVKLVVSMEAGDSAEPKMCFDVIDSGVGISEEMLPKMFQPFFQVDGSSSRRHSGTGLGLVISRKLAHMLQGEITVTSTANVGSTFSLTVATGPLADVPLIRPTQQENPQEDSPALPQTSEEPINGRILVCEDGPDNQRLIAFVLRRAGAHVELADDGKIGCERAMQARREGRPFDLVLMDMQMPVLDGYAATERLRNEGFAGPIIALTAHAMTGERERCIRAGCDEYLSKPIDRKALLQAIRAYMPQAQLPAQNEPAVSGN